MSRENFAIEVKNARLHFISRAEWTGKGRIPHITACLEPAGFLTLTAPADFKGFIELKGNLEHYEKDGNNWTYRWSQAAEEQLVGQATLTLKHDLNTVSDVVVAVKMSRTPDVIIKRPPFLTCTQILAATGIGFIAGLALLLVFVLR